MQILSSFSTLYALSSQKQKRYTTHDTPPMNRALKSQTGHYGNYAFLLDQHQPIGREESRHFGKYGWHYGFQSQHTFRFS